MEGGGPIVLMAFRVVPIVPFGKVRFTPTSGNPKDAGKDGLLGNAPVLFNEHKVVPVNGLDVR